MLAQDDRALPEFIGKYRVRARLGEGGMADVFLAYLEGPAGFVKPVAIKRMKPALAQSEEFVELFLTEARTASMLSHPNVCQVNELGASEHEGGYYMVMEYLVGVPFTKILARQIVDRDTFPPGLLLGLAAQACEGMHYAHSLCDPRGESYDIVHRDLSPPNIYMTSNGMAKILDFGISKSTQSVVQTATGQIRGKFTYMSPEQLRGHDLDPRSDVFSLAIIVFELLTGTRLFKRASRLETFEAVSRTPIPRVDSLNKKVPKAVADVVEVGLARDRTHRFATARAFGTALAETAQGCGGVWTAPLIAEFGQSIFAEDLRAHSKWLDAAQSGQFEAIEEPVGFHNNAELTVADAIVSQTEARTKVHNSRSDTDQDTE